MEFKFWEEEIFFSIRAKLIPMRERRNLLFFKKGQHFQTDFLYLCHFQWFCFSSCVFKLMSEAGNCAPREAAVIPDFEIKVSQAVMWL